MDLKMLEMNGGHGTCSFKELSFKILLFIRYDYSNEFCHLSSRYGVDNFEEKVLEMYKEIVPLYKQLYAYIRRQLNEKYGQVC